MIGHLVGMLQPFLWAWWCRLTLDRVQSNHERIQERGTMTARQFNFSFVATLVFMVGSWLLIAWGLVNVALELFKEV